MALSEELKRFYSSGDYGATFAQTISLSHPAFTGPAYHLTTHDEAFLGDIGGGQRVTYTPWPISVTDPVENANGSPSFQISFALDDGEMIAEIKRALEYRFTSTPTKVTADIRIYQVGAGAATTGNPPAFVRALTPSPRVYLSGASVSATTLTARASLGNRANMKFPRIYYTPELFPGLVRG